MSTVTRPYEAAFDAPPVALDWQPDAVARLDQSHLVAWSPQPTQQIVFTSSLQHFLRGQPDLDVCNLHGRSITSLDSFCHQVERLVPVGRLDRTLFGRHGVVSALRRRVSAQHEGFGRARYFVWNDADVLLEADRGLFGELVDALAGVAAEWEYVSEDMLVIQRCVFVGGRALSEYAADATGQFRSWKRDEQGEPFWQSATGLEQPPIAVERIDALMW